jgi:hypothetical protein
MKGNPEKGKGNLLFVNKKKQKNFVRLGRCETPHRPVGVKVFCFFFSKKKILA